MCLGTSFPAWQAEAIRELMRLPEVEIGLLILPDRADSPGGIRRLLAEPRHLLWNLYNKGYIQRRSVASRSVDMSDELRGVPDIICQTLPVGRFGEALSEEDLEVIRGHDLDVILRFAFGILKGDILETPRYGVWSFHHGDEREYRGQPPGFWEMMEGETTVGTILQRITERLDGGTVLERGRFKLTPHSYRRTRDEAFSGGAVFASIAVRRILSGDMSRVDAAPSTTEAPLRRSPGNMTMLRFLLRQVAAFLRSQWQGMALASKWSVGIADVPVASLLEGAVPEFSWAPEQGKSRYLADPFLDPTGATSTVLVEDYDHDSHRGVISALDLDGDRVARPVLDAGVHASYPYLLTRDGDVYCIPETYQAEEVRLYRSLSFPEKWELAGVLLGGGRFLDPTIVRHRDRWWLFCTYEGADSNTKLYAFHSIDLEGPWEQHVLNPIKCDVTSSRPGGTPFMVDGSLFRPAQDSSSSYGGAVAINRVDRLDPDGFEETIVTRIGPLQTGRYRAGIHTVSGHGERTVVDGRRDVFVFSAFRRELKGRLRRLLRRR